MEVSSALKWGELVIGVYKKIGKNCAAIKSRYSAFIFFSNSAIGLFIGRRMVMHVVLQ